MSGLSRTTAQRLEFDAHLAQSIHDILTTPKGTRVMRRAYGSDLPLLIDAPINGETLIDLFAATAEAIATWEPRFTLRRVEVPEARAGHVSLLLSGEVNGAAVTYQAEVGA
jgi:uncharacterized protein